mmetsp:Transcript_37268/g.76054  ORF Transcript_37268/g.76054 Transcript_37268/m.76054 type:complete len:220 (+) Transcript_37268:234-893(+)
MMRAPDAPSGWPSAMAPPHALVFSRGRFRAFSTARYCAANASLTSIRSMSSTVRLARARAIWKAGTGPKPMIVGSTPAMPHDTTRASGVKPLAVTASSLATTIAAAPSVMPDAVPAVTVPSFLNTVGSLPSDSAVVPARGPSSVSNTSMPLRPLISIGSISDLNLPAALASAQACWLRAPYASVSARVRLYSSARFSAVMPMGVLHRLSVSPAQSVSTS